MDGNLDENLELFFGLSVPFLDSKIGVQGVDESFSFIVSETPRSPTLTSHLHHTSLLSSKQLIDLHKDLAVSTQMNHRIQKLPSSMHD